MPLATRMGLNGGFAISVCILDGENKGKDTENSYSVIAVRNRSPDAFPFR